jgi:hypothetical protein
MPGAPYYGNKHSDNFKRPAPLPPPFPTFFEAAPLSHDRQFQKQEHGPFTQLNDRQSRTQAKGEVSTLFLIKTGVPKGRVLGPLLYILFTSDLPQAPNVTIGTFADDTTLLTSHMKVLRTSTTLREYLHVFYRWLQKWKIKVKETKSSYLTFTPCKDPSPPIYLNEGETPPAKTVKYPGLHLDTKLIWRDHITKKRKQMDLRYKELYWLLGRSSPPLNQQ